MEPARPADVILDFPGLSLNADPRDLPPGAAEEQTNMASDVPGEMRSRLGFREVEFEG